LIHFIDNYIPSNASFLKFLHIFIVNPSGCFIESAKSARLSPGVKAG